MNNFESLASECSFDEFEYQLLYLRPSVYLDERIAVGVVAELSNRLEARFVSSVGTIEMMTRLLGVEGVEQFQFAASELRRSISNVANLDSLRLPTDLFVAGEKLVAFTPDRPGLLASILSSSCLAKSRPERCIERPMPTAAEFCKDIVGHVSRLSPLVADRIFNRKVTIEAEEVKLPIFGQKIFGAPVSFAVRDYTMQTEAYIAKFRWLRFCLSREPRIYVLRPQGATHDQTSDLRLKKLHSIAEASGVPLRVSDTTEEIATQILQDEAA